jgi:predicted HTH transcriptional regulator
MRSVALPFENRLATLTLEELQTFLDRELEEGLTWEAKGSHEPRPEQVRKAVSGFANAIGGTLILGAERDGAHWRLEGAAFRGGEGSTWLSSVIGGLSPPPRCSIRVFPTATEGQLVALVAVEPIDVPPCMSGGSVYVRVSGRTVPVTDPAQMRSLLERGDAARKRALELAVTLRERCTDVR